MKLLSIRLFEILLSFLPSIGLIWPQCLPIMSHCWSNQQVNTKNFLSSGQLWPIQKTISWELKVKGSSSVSVGEVRRFFIIIATSWGWYKVLGRKTGGVWMSLGLYTAKRQVGSLVVISSSASPKPIPVGRKIIVAANESVILVFK